MFDNTQVLLIVVITVLTILLTVIGIQVFFILGEVKKTIEKFNKIIDDAGVISESIAKPISSISGSIEGASGIVGLLSWLTKRKKKSAKTEEEEK